MGPRQPSWPAPPGKATPSSSSSRARSAPEIDPAAADYRLFETITRRVVVDTGTPAIVRSVYRDMRERVLERMRELGIELHRASLHLGLEMRFVGQAFEVPVELDVDTLPELTVEELLSSTRRFWKKSMK